MSHSSNPARGLIDHSQPAVSAFGLGMGALIMAVFGFIWLGWGLSVSRLLTDFSSGSALPATRWISFYVLFLTLLGISIQTLRRGKTGMRAVSATPAEFRSGFSKSFR